MIYIGLFSAFFLPFPLILSGAVLVPSVLGVLCLASAAKRGTFMILSNGYLAAAIFFFLVLSALFTPGLEEIWVEKLKTSSQLLLSLVLASFAFTEFSKIPRNSRAKFYKIALLIVLAVATVEIFVSPVGEAINELRGHLYLRSSGAALERDVAAYGMLRPIFLTAEPSYLGYSVAIFLSLLLISSGNSIKDRRFFFALVLCLVFIVRSPIVLLLPFATYTVISYKTHPIQTLKGLLFAFAAIVAILYLWHNFSHRPADILTGKDFSAFSRMFAPALLIHEYFPRSIFLGAGLGGESQLIDAANEVFTKAGFAIRISIMNDQAIVYSAMPSYFWQILIFFGVIGGFIFVFLVYRFIHVHVFRRGFRTDCIFPIVLFFFAGFFIGRFVNLATWISLLLFALELNSRADAYDRI